MTKVQGFGIVIAFAAGVAGVWGACKSPAAPGGVLLTGSWGSTDGHLTATESNMRWVGACGSGSANAPIMLDEHGHFDMVGTYGSTSGASEEARFKGSVSPKKLTLLVFSSDSTKMLGPVNLDLGQFPTLAICH